MILNKYFFTVTLAVLFFYTVTAQNTKHSIGGSISPDYLIGLTPNGVAMSYGFHTRYKDKPVLGYTTSIYLNYYFKKKLSLLIGISYSKKGYKREYRHRSFNDFTFYQGEIDERVYRYMEFPLKLKYDFKVSDKVALYLAPGASYSVIKESIQKITYPAPNQTEFVFNNTEFERNNINLLFGIGVDIKLTSSWIITLNPEYRKMRNEHFLGSGRRIYSPGINTGIRFIL